MGMVWTFEFILVEDIAGTSFTHIKLLQGIIMGVGIFLGEVPSLFLSGECYYPMTCQVLHLHWASPQVIMEVFVT